MTKEEKQLLLQDLCARLPYGVMVKHPNGHCKIESYEYGKLDSVFIYADEIYLTLDTHDECDFILNEKIKPYLRPMSSMTMDEEKEYFSFYFFEKNCFNNTIGAYKLLDWLNAHHFDYRRLIEKGLAIEAPEGMYNTKTK